MPYHNTTQEPEPKLFQVKAANQDQIVLSIFRKHADLTASECHRLFQNVQTPLTSIRRSITDLCNELDQYGHYKGASLKKTAEKRIGLYGRPEYVYKIINRL